MTRVQWQNGGHTDVRLDRSNVDGKVIVIADHTPYREDEISYTREQAIDILLGHIRFCAALAAAIEAV